MPTEITVLALAGLLQAAQMVLYSVSANRQVRTSDALGPRDQAITLTGAAGRIQRAMNNHFEGLILFTLAVVVVTLGEKSSTLTVICAWVYLGARVLYVPAYIFGLVPWRSLIWAVGWGASVLMFIAALSA